MITSAKQVRPKPKRLAMMHIGGPVCVCVLLMLVLIVSAQWDSYRGNFLVKEQEWREVQGRVTRSQIVRKHRSYRPDVRYVYWTRQGSFQGNKVSFGYQGFPRESEALQVTNKYRVGQNVVVYCLYKEPSFSVLDLTAEPGSLATAKGVLLSIPLVVVCFIVMVYLEIRNRRRTGTGDVRSQKRDC